MDQLGCLEPTMLMLDEGPDPSMREDPSGQCWHCQKREPVQEALAKRGLTKLSGPFRLGEFICDTYIRNAYKYCKICRKLYFAADEKQREQIEADAKKSAQTKCYANDGYVAVKAHF